MLCDVWKDRDEVQRSVTLTFIGALCAAVSGISVPEKFPSRFVHFDENLSDDCNSFLLPVLTLVFL